MGIANAVATCHLEIGAIAIVDEYTGEAGKQAKVPDGIAAAMATDALPGEDLGTRDMEPMELACDAQSGFIGVGDGGLNDQTANLYQVRLAQASDLDEVGLFHP